MADWTEMMRLHPQDPYAEIDYLFEWGPFLAGANLAVAEVLATGATVENYAVVNAAQDVTCRIKSGVAATGAIELSCSIETDDSPPRKDKRSVTIGVHDL